MASMAATWAISMERAASTSAIAGLVPGASISHYVALSKDLEQYLGRDVGVEPVRIAQIYNLRGCRAFFACCQRPGLHRGMSIHRRGPIGLWVPWAGYSRGSNQVMLAEAFVLAGQRAGAHAQMRLVMIGDGAGQERVSSKGTGPGWYASTCLAAGRCVMELRGLDCFALPSLAEGISNTLPRRWRARVLVVATRVGGNPELIQTE